MTTAAAIIIGDEILTGKVKDTNIHLLISTLRDAGVTLRRVVTIGDEPDEIAEEVKRCASLYDYVFTSGGVGPTHDDCTMQGVARAFGRRVVRDPAIERIVRGHWKDRLNEAALKLAELPEGSRLMFAEDGLLPLVVFENVYILPGVPQIFAAKLRRLGEQLVGTPSVVQSIYLSSDESSIAEHLSQVTREIRGIKIGSYPRMDHADHRVRITVEATEPDLVERAVRRLLELLPSGRIVRVDEGSSDE